MSISSKDQYTALERKVSVLKDENSSLQSQLADAHKKIKQLDEATRSAENSQREGGGLSADSEQVLRVLFDDCRELADYQIASAISQDISTTQYHLDLLMKRDLVLPGKCDWNPLDEISTQYYGLDVGGRAYVIENLKK